MKLLAYAAQLFGKNKKPSDTVLGVVQETSLPPPNIRNSIDSLLDQLKDHGFMPAFMSVSEYLGEKSVSGHTDLVRGILEREDPAGYNGIIVSRGRSNGMDVVALVYPPEPASLGQVRLGVLQYGNRTIPFVGETSLQDYIYNDSKASFVVSLIGHFGGRGTADLICKRGVQPEMQG